MLFEIRTKTYKDYMIHQILAKRFPKKIYHQKTKLRLEAGIDSELCQFKLFANSTFGKFIGMFFLSEKRKRKCCPVTEKITFSPSQKCQKLNQDHLVQ